ncbi:alpha-2-HS-glycoprotein [Discoglossus pictus]
MRLLLVSLFFAQMLFCTGVSLSVKPSGRLIDCDDPEAHEAASVSVHHINAHHHHGYKYRLQRVENIKALPETAQGEVFILELDLLETICPVVSPTPVENCSVRPAREQGVEGDCDVKLVKLGGNFTVHGVRCKSEIESAEDFCAGCKFLAPLNDTRVAHAVDSSLVKFNSGNNTVFYKLHEIGRAKMQAVSGNKVDVEYVIVASNCSLDDASLNASSCVVQTNENRHYGACHATLFKQLGAEGNEEEDVTVQCTIYDPQPGIEPQPVIPADPLAPAQPKVVHGLFHHNLHHSSLGPISSESSSAEHAAPAKQAVKRSLTGEPVPPSIVMVPLCPGRKIFH